MLGAVGYPVVIGGDCGRAAVLGPAGYGATLAVKYEKRRLLPIGGGNEKAASAVVDLAGRIGLHPGCRGRNRNPVSVGAGDGSGLDLPSTTIEGRQVAVVVGDPEGQPWSDGKTPGILQIGVDGGHCRDHGVVIGHQGGIGKRGGCRRVRCCAGTAAAAAAATAAACGDRHDTNDAERKRRHLTKTLLHCCSPKSKNKFDADMSAASWRESFFRRGEDSAQR